MGYNYFFVNNKSKRHFMEDSDDDDDDDDEHDYKDYNDCESDGYANKKKFFKLLCLVCTLKFLLHDY